MIYRRLHRWGISRMLNSSSNNFNDRGTAYIQTRGPRRLGRWLAVKVIHWSHLRADWDSIRIERTEHQGRWHYRWHLAFRRTEPPADDLVKLDGTTEQWEERPDLQEKYDRLRAQHIYLGHISSPQVNHDGSMWPNPIWVGYCSCGLAFYAPNLTWAMERQAAHRHNLLGTTIQRRVGIQIVDHKGRPV